MTLLDYLSDVEVLQDFTNAAQKWHAGQPVNERSFLGDQGIYEKLLPALQAVWRYAGLDEHSSLFPTMVKLQARPAYELMLAMFTLLSNVHVGPTHFWSLFYATNYAGGILDWRLHVDVNEWAEQPAGATQVEFEICTRAPTAGIPSGTGQRFYCAIDNSPQQGQNVLAVDPTYLVSYRARFCAADGAPLSLWAYSNEELPFDIAIPPLVPVDYPSFP